MKHPFINFSFTKIGEIKHKNGQAVSVAKQTLNLVKHAFEIIKKNVGEEEAKNTLYIEALEYALNKIIRHGENHTVLLDLEVYIFYQFLYLELKKSEEIIDQEMPQLNL